MAITDSDPMKNGGIRNLRSQLLSDHWGNLRKYQYEYHREDGSWEMQQREVYDRGNGVAVLLYKKDSDRILLTRQFRLPTHLNGNEGGMMVEVCAGVWEEGTPEEAMLREIEEETGYRLPAVEHVLTTYTSPGSVSEHLHLYLGEYDTSMKVSEGGGADEETEHIEVLEISLPEAMDWIRSGKIQDAKSIILIQYKALLNAQSESQ